MSSIQQFYQLPISMQKEVLDFMIYIAEKNGIELKDTDLDSRAQKWSTRVPVFKTTGKLISETVVQLREEEKW